jgi:hypothetical protein
MESSTNSTRRSEDIALDLLKFVSAHAGLGNKTASSTGFGLPNAPKSEDQLTQIFDLYARCRVAVESPAALDSAALAAKK